MAFSLQTTQELRLERKKKAKRFALTLSILVLACLLLFALELFTGVSNMSFPEAFLALFGQGTPTAIRIMQRIRLTRAIAAMLVGGGLGVAGLLMQTSLANPMASPGTLGVSNAAVLGANIAIILMSNDPVNGTTWSNPNPYGVAGIAFVCAIASTVLVLALGQIKRFSPTTIILVGIGLGAGLQAITTLIQYFAADNTLASAVYWSFGDIGRVNLADNLLLLIVVVVSFVAFILLSNRYDSLLLGEDNARSLGVRVSLLRVLGLMLASFITATIVSLCGIIGFVGIVAPHICRRIVGNSHRCLIPATLCVGALLVAFSDFVGRLVSLGTSLPVGAVTALIGAPFFIVLVFTKKEKVS